MITYKHPLYKQNNNERKKLWINLIHILLFAPLIMYTQRMYFEILLMLGYSAVVYHTFYFVKSLK
jgi:hypothetical protein